MNTKDKGDLAQLAVAKDLMIQGYKIAFPYGDSWDYDLIACKDGIFYRVQVKYTESNGEVVVVDCSCRSTHAGKTTTTKMYTAEMIDWIAVYDKQTDISYYIAASQLGSGKSELYLRLVPSKNNQQKGIRWARDYLSMGV